MFVDNKSMTHVILFIKQNGTWNNLLFCYQASEFVMEPQYNVKRNHIFVIPAIQYKLPSHHITRRVSIEARNSANCVNAFWTRLSHQVW